MCYDDKNSKRIHWVSYFLLTKNTVVYFGSFGIKYIPDEVLSKIWDKSINHNIFRIQDNESIMCRIYCIALIEYTLTEKILLDYTS